MSRDERRLQNAKSQSRGEVDFYPQNLPEGDVVYATPKNKPLRLYKKKKGFLWWKNFTRDGNETVDKNLEVRGDLTVRRNLAVSDQMTVASQPSFLAHNNADDSNIAPDEWVRIDFNIEDFDVGENFASDTFTAPVDGKYFLQTVVRLKDLDIDATAYSVQISTTNRNYVSSINPTQFAGDVGVWSFNLSTVADMSASNTASIQMYQTGGATQTDVAGHATIAYTYFSGYLLG